VTIFVDDARWRSRRNGMVFCHLVSDAGFAELHSFAADTGLPPRAFHRDHYDVPAHMRDAVVAAGAVPADSRTLVRHLHGNGLRKRRRLAPRPPDPWEPGC